MAILKDVKFVQTIAESIGLEEVSDSACQRILIEVEKKLRTLIFRGNKYKKSAFRDVMKAEDLTAALKDLGMSEILGHSSDQEMKFLKVMDVWSPITNVNPLLNFQGNRSQTANNSRYKHSEVNQYSKASNSLGFSRWSDTKLAENECEKAKEGDLNNEFGKDKSNAMEEEDESIDTSEDKNDRNLFLIKIGTSGLLSKELYAFLKNLLERYDAVLASVDDFSFADAKPELDTSLLLANLVTQWLSKHAGIGPILPFLAKIIFHEHDIMCTNYETKRLVMLKMVQALARNPNISLEFQFHQIVVVLVNFITNSFDCQILKNKSARLLADLLYEFEDKYPLLKESIFGFLLEIIFSVDQEVRLDGILMFISHLDCEFLTRHFLPKLRTLSEKGLRPEDNLHLHSIVGKIISNLPFLYSFNSKEAFAVYLLLNDLYGETLGFCSNRLFSTSKVKRFLFFNDGGCDINEMEIIL